MGERRLSRIAAIGETDVVDHGRQEYHRSHAAPPGEWPFLQDRPSLIRRMILVGTAPRGGEDIMHLEKPSLAKHLQDPRNSGYAVLQKIFFAPTTTSQAAGEA